MATEGKEDDGGAVVTLRFVVQPEGFPHFVEVPRSSSVEAVKERLEAELQLPASAMLLHGSGCEDAEDLMHLEAGAEHEVYLTLERSVLEAAAPAEYSLPSSMEVVVHFDDDTPSKTITVDIERDEQGREKPYLGGFRNKETGVEFHHAESQRFSQKQLDARARSTGQGQGQEGKEQESGGENGEEAAAERGDARYTRETQTAVEVSRSAQTGRESGTQMGRSDVVIDSRNDRTLEPKEYFDSESLHKVKVVATVVMQRYWRGFMARQQAGQFRLFRRERQEEQVRLRDQRAVEEKEEHAREVSRRTNPQTSADFEILYNELENWRQHETTRIKASNLHDDERQLQLEELLHKETKLLQTIDRLKLSANKTNKQKRINKLLSVMAAPKKWKMSDGDVALVHTPFTTRAKELADLYSALHVTGASVDHRLDTLLNVKWTAKEFDCALTRDLVDLIDREADLLNRGRAEKALQGLRKRITTLFLQFVETPEFNPEAARFALGVGVGVGVASGAKQAQIVDNNVVESKAVDNQIE